MRKRNLFMSTALMCGLFSIAFNFDQDGIHWMWSDHKPVALVLAVATIILGTLWFKATKKTNNKNV